MSSSSLSLSDKFILTRTDAQAIQKQGVVQKLWRGYGQIERYTLQNARFPQVILKRIFSAKLSAADISQQRKLQSYQIESYWYQNWEAKTQQICRLPRYLGSIQTQHEILLLLEDLGASGFTEAQGKLSPAQITSCLAWLTKFHAFFLGCTPQHLWPIGSYWHLATRQAEWQNMSESPLKWNAALLDNHLNQAKYQTLIHGDAKPANFCFDPQGDVAGLDFQYVGGGPGIKDVVYFLDASLTETELINHAQDLLAEYFSQLREACRHLALPIDCAELEKEWRWLYPIAWSDFQRFLFGWQNHYRWGAYSKEQFQICQKRWDSA